MMLTREEVSLLETPCYVFDEEELRDNFQDFSSALHDGWSADSRVAYSVKTNSLPCIIEVAKECDCLAEVVSDDEYELALECGFKPSQIVFNGPIKGRDFFEYALRNGSLVNIDSKREIRWACELAHSGNEIKLGIRANITLEKYCPGECLSDDYHGRFGFSYEGGDLEEAIDELRSHGVEIVGLHMHVTTRSRSCNVYDVLSSFATKIIEEFDLTLDYVDMGGGYFGGGANNVGAYDDYVLAIAKNLSKVCDPSKTKLIVEPGGAVVCTPGYYVGRVVDSKSILDENYVVSELSRINIDHEMKKTSYNMTIFSDAECILPEQTLCGYTCMDSDRLCMLKNEPKLSEGDIIVINFAGAYSSTFTPGMFIEHPPAVYMKTGQGMVCARPLYKARFV